jgi:hypothetical protein
VFSCRRSKREPREKVLSFPDLRGGIMVEVLRVVVRGSLPLHPVSPESSGDPAKGTQNQLSGWSPGACESQSMPADNIGCPASGTDQQLCGRITCPALDMYPPCPGNMQALIETSAFLKGNAASSEWHCGERRAEECNLDLGGRLGRSALDFLAGPGIDAAGMEAMSCG